MPARFGRGTEAHVTVAGAVGTAGVLLALLLLSAAWAGRRPGWQIVFGPPAESANRIALTEFYAEACDQGWDFPADRQLALDLAIGLRDAGLADGIEMWGRRCRTLAALRGSAAPLQRIPAPFWKHHDIDGLRMVLPGAAADATGGSIRLETNNFLIRTRALPNSDPDFGDVSYEDIHLNYLQATGWLQTGAGRYRGISRRGFPGQASADRP